MQMGTQWITGSGSIQHLRKSEEKMENMANYYDVHQELSGVFWCKPISKWSAVEVQEAIDEHQREHQERRRPIKPEKLKIVTAAATACLPVFEKLTAMRPGVQEPPTQPKVSAVNSSEAGALERVLSMLEGVLARAASPVQQLPSGHAPLLAVYVGTKLTSHVNTA